MKLISVFLALVSLVSGHIIQADIRIHPEKYNLMTIDTSNLPEPVEAPTADDFVQLSEVNMHYRIYGEGGAPLILIHGNGGSVDSLAAAARYLANDYTVYVTESRCHGQSSDPGVISYELMAKDIAEFVAAMGIKKPIVMGHSDGAIIALALAADHPELPGAIIVCGANSDPSTFWPYFPAGVRIRNAVRRDKLNDLMLNEPHFTAEYLAKINCPAYIVSGEFDIMRQTDTVFIRDSVPGSDMAIIKGADHSSYISRDGGQAYALAVEWLNQKGI